MLTAGAGSGARRRQPGVQTRSPWPPTECRRPAIPQLQFRRGRERLRDDAGSGTAIGVAILFPILMFVIIAISLLSESGRIDQTMQNTANRTARIAALCCHHTGGPNGAEEVVRASLTAATGGASANRLLCNNDVAGDSRIAFVNAAGNDVPIGPNVAVPPGGTAYVFITCRVPPEILGGFGFPGLDVRRRAEGIASIDPFRSRSGG